MSINAHNSSHAGQDSLPTPPASVSRVAKPSEVGRQRVVKIGQAATMLALSVKSVRRLIDRGHLRRVKGIRHVLIPITEIDKFLT